MYVDVFEGAPDGIKIDIRGNVWTAVGDGVHVFNPLGDLIGRKSMHTTDRDSLAVPSSTGKIKVPGGAVSLVFGGPARDYLLITADTALYGVALQTSGA
jgi:gluconolactonase